MNARATERNREKKFDVVPPRKIGLDELPTSEEDDSKFRFLN